MRNHSRGAESWSDKGLSYLWTMAVDDYDQASRRFFDFRHYYCRKSRLPRPCLAGCAASHPSQAVTPIRSLRDWSWRYPQGLDVCISAVPQSVLGRCAKAKGHQLWVLQVLVPATFHGKQITQRRLTRK